MGEKALTSVALLSADHLDVSEGYGFRIETGAFIFVRRGRGQVFINLRDYDVSMHDFITIMPGSIININQRSEDFEAYYILFSGGFSRDQDLWKNTLYSLVSILENPVIRIGDMQSVSFISSYCAMLMELNANNTIKFKTEIIKNMLEAIMFAVSGFYQDAFASSNTNIARTPITRNHELFKEFLMLVMRFYESEREVAFYADRLCITPKHLGYVVKSVSGKLASDLIARAVIMDAKSKLKTTGLSVRQIADSLNFPNPSFFGKYFRKHVGMTPKEYREGKNTNT